MFQLFQGITSSLSFELSHLQTKPRKLFRVRRHQLRAWLCKEIDLNTRPDRLLKACREIFVGALRAGLVALILFAVIKLDIFPWLTDVARKLSPANLADIEDIKSKDEERDRTANLVIEKLRHDFGLRTELLNGVVSTSGKKIASDLVKLTQKQIDYVNANHGDIPISFGTRFKETPVVTVTYMNLQYARPGDARNTLKTARRVCTDVDCMVIIRWTDPRSRSNAVTSKLQLYWVAVGEFPDDDGAQRSSGGDVGKDDAK